MCSSDEKNPNPTPLGATHSRIFQTITNSSKNFNGGVEQAYYSNNSSNMNTIQTAPVVTKSAEVRPERRKKHQRQNNSECNTAMVSFTSNAGTAPQKQQRKEQQNNHLLIQSGHPGSQALTSLPLPSCRSRSPGGKGNKPEVSFSGATGRNKGQAGVSTTFVNLKETLDKKLQDEIEALIQQNGEREAKLREVNQHIMDENRALQEQLDDLKSNQNL